MSGQKSPVILLVIIQVGLSVFVGAAPAWSMGEGAGSGDAPVTVPIDRTPILQVREIRISGNTLLSAEELLGNLPAEYVYVVTPNDTASRREVYDFGVVQEIVAAPGSPRPVSKRTMEGLTRCILSKYRSRGFAGIYVYVMADAAGGAARFSDDVMRLRVIESHVADIAIEHRRFDPNEPNDTDERVGMLSPRFWLPPVFGPAKRKYVTLKDGALRAWSPAQPGQVIPGKQLEQFVAVLNTNPDRYLSAVVSPSQEPNAVNLAYEIYEADPWHFYVQLDDAGTEERQWSPRMGLVNTNVTGQDDRFSAMYQLDVDQPDENYAAFGTYDRPFLTPRLRVGVYGGYSQFDIGPEATGGLTSFLGDGSFFGATVRYNVAQLGKWLVDLTGSVSSESSRVQRIAGPGSDIDLHLFGVGFQVYRTRETSTTQFAFERLQNYDGSSPEEFANARIDTDPDFARYALSLVHRQFLDAKRVHEIRTRFRGITSDARLVPAKMTTFGGLYTVRGYAEDEIVADGGFLGSLEYRYDLTKSVQGVQDDRDGKAKRPSRNRVSLLAFTDFGRPEMQDPVAGEFDTQDMWGVGLGTLIEFGSNFQAGIYHGWALRETERGDGTVITDQGDARWNFNFVYRW